MNNNLGQPLFFYSPFRRRKNSSLLIVGRSSDETSIWIDVLRDRKANCMAQSISSLDLTPYLCILVGILLVVVVASPSAWIDPISGGWFRMTRQRDRTHGEPCNFGKYAFSALGTFCFFRCIMTSMMNESRFSRVLD